MTQNAFAHHPELLDLITDPHTSRFRDFSLENLQKMMDEHGLKGGWWFSDEVREAAREAFFAGREPGDMWVFAYGSLMTDPGVHFTEVRRATLPGHTRRFILRDENGARGTPEAPGLMAALDTAPQGEACDGLAFRISADLVEPESKLLWAREMIAPGYHAVMVPAQVGEATVPILAFTADHEAEVIDGTLSHAEQVRLIAKGTGIFGSSLEYLEKIDRQFAALGITDDAITRLLTDVRALNAPAL